MNTQFTADVIDDVVLDDVTDGIELLDVNWQTTAAVGLTVASGGVLGAISLAAFPAQTLAVAGGISALAYTGKRRADGKDAVPFLKKDAKAKSDSKTKAKSSTKTEVNSEDKSSDESSN